MKHTFLILFIFILLGCSRKDLFYGDTLDPGSIEISTDWSNIEDIPGGIIAYLYPENSSDNSDNSDPSEPIIEYISNQGSTISLPYGSYYGFIINDYTNEILFRNMDDRLSAEAFLNRSDEAPFATRSPQTKHIGNLESFYKVQIGSFALTQESPLHTAIVIPKLKSLKIDLIISLEKVENIAYARGTLSGVNDAINLSNGLPSADNTANIIFDFKLTENTIIASIRCFGINNLNTAGSLDIGSIVKNNLEIAFILKDGIQIVGEHIFDITDRISQIVPVVNDGVYEDISIVLDNLGIIVPDVQGSGDGFDLEVGDWDDPIIEELH